MDGTAHTVLAPDGSHEEGPASHYRSVFRPGLFAGRTVVVTGAGSGIGRCTAHELAALGTGVALVGRRAERLEEVRAEVERAGGRAACWPCDIRDEERVQRAIAGILANFGRIDGLVNNAGGQFVSPLEDISLKGWEAVVRTNLTGGFLMAREIYRQWMRDHGGAIVNIVADMWGGMPGMAHSGAARAGMVNLTETAAYEWAKAHVRVNAVAPGWIASAGIGTYPPEVQEAFRARRRVAPMRRFGRVDEVSAAIVFLLSDAAAFISGATLRVDGAVPNARHTYSLPDHAPSPEFTGFEDDTRPVFLD